MDIMSALAIVSQTLNITKTIKDIDRSFDAAEYKAKIVDILSGLTDAKMALLEAQEAMSGKDADIARLTAALKEKFETVQEGQWRYLKNEEGKPRGIPFCPLCLQKHGLYIQIAQLENPKVGYEYVCPNCKSSYGRNFTHYVD